MILTFKRIDNDLYDLNLRINNTQLRLNNAKLGYAKDLKIFRVFYKNDIQYLTRKLKNLKVRRECLNILASFPEIVKNITMKDYKDTTKLYLMLYQNKCVEQFEEQQKQIEQLRKSIASLQIKIK